MNIRPLYDRIVVKRIEGDVEKTSVPHAICLSCKGKVHRPSKANCG